jgi:hypothetical protein
LLFIYIQPNKDYLMFVNKNESILHRYNPYSLR